MDPARITPPASPPCPQWVEPPFIGPGHQRVPFDVDLLPESEYDKQEVCVVGAGPGGLAVAARIAAGGYRVCLVDPDPTLNFVPTYGTWVDEFEALGLGDCFEKRFSHAAVELGGEYGRDGFRKLRRPYARIDRAKLKLKLLGRCKEAGVRFVVGKADRVSHAGGASTVHLMGAGGKRVVASLVVDCTGHARRLVEYDQPFDPGYQGAYGILCEVESHPYDLDQMLFMDWKDEHCAGRHGMKARNDRLPTFLYAMPLSDKVVFFEETSLVARPAVPFDDLKERLYARLQAYGVRVTGVIEEELCLIPMGGVLPALPQRVIGLGGTAGHVHPSTGFMVARVLAASATLGCGAAVGWQEGRRAGAGFRARGGGGGGERDALFPSRRDAVVDALDGCSRDEVRGIKRPVSEAEATAMSEAIWKTTWPLERLRQREFFCFGMDVLLALDLAKTRQFFDAFFRLSDRNWQGFLSARLMFTELVLFGLQLFASVRGGARLVRAVGGERCPRPCGFPWPAAVVQRVPPQPPPAGHPRARDHARQPVPDARRRPGRLPPQVGSPYLPPWGSPGAAPFRRCVEYASEVQRSKERRHCCKICAGNECRLRRRL